ncbi:MAG: PAS domain S-box protein [Bacillota bacterium]|nr:PAS domain S-box protein [Bacillota bacterium]
MPDHLNREKDALKSKSKRKYKAKKCPEHNELHRAKLALEASREGVWDWNMVTGTNIVSENWAQMIGYSLKEVNQDYDFFWNRIHPDDRERMTLIRGRYLRGELPEYHVVFRLMAKDGQLRWILSRGKVVEWDEAGNPQRMVGTHQDITRQKKAEEALKYQKGVLESFFRYSPDAMAHLNTQQEVLQANEQFTRLFGYTEMECYHKRLDDLITDKELRHEAAEITRATEENQTIEVETLRVHKDGTRIPVVIRGGPVIVEGRIVGYQGIYTDITQRKREEAQLLEAKARAEAASQVKSRFLSNVSHEIRTPLNGIHGAALLLETTLLSKDQQELVEILKESSERMVETVNNLLDVSRIESGRLELQEEVFELFQTVSEVLEPFQAAVRDQQIVFNLYPGDDSRVQLVGDRSKLVRILFHLVSNAFKFTAAGSIDITVSLLRFEDPIAIYRFSVADTGIGIQPEDLSRLFQRFYQLDDTYSKAYQGAGLGLAIVQDLVELMGGGVSVESTPGQGSCFSFEIPFRVHEYQSRASLQKEKIDQAVLGRNIRILVVENDEISRDLLERMCQKLGVQMDAARDGFDAIRKFGAVEYDLVIMDVQLPGISGIEVTSVIRSFEKKLGERTPIIGLSAHALQENRERCLEVGMNDYLSKPIDIETLNQVIQEWVR